MVEETNDLEKPIKAQVGENNPPNTPEFKSAKKGNGEELKNKIDRLEELVFRPLLHTSKSLYIFVGILVSIIAFGIYAYSIQFTQGLIVTGMGDTVSWGLYITSFVFFIGISHVGAMMSAILRLSNAGWRTPLTRMAESITACSLLVGAVMILIDMGRVDRMLNLFYWGRFYSPIFWDMLAVTSYLFGSLLFLYLPMIPDIALVRDKLTNISKWRKKLYKFLAMGWKGTKSQKKHLEKAMLAMTIIIIPLAISVHTVVSWIFSMTYRIGWNSTVFAPYFVSGALFSGVAAVILAMAIFRHVYNLHEYITPRHFKNLAYIMLVLNLVYIYFTLSEYFTPAYKHDIEEAALLASLFTGQYALIFWSTIIGGLIIPAAIVIIPQTRNIKGFVIAAILINIFMWTKRYVIIIPAMARPMFSYEWGQYNATWVEWAITAAGFSAFILFQIIFAKFFPIISIWEVKEEAEKEEKIKSHEPGTKVQLTECPMCKADVFNEADCPICKEPLNKWRDRKQNSEVKNPT